MAVIIEQVGVFFGIELHRSVSLLVVVVNGHLTAPPLLTDSSHGRRTSRGGISFPDWGSPIHPIQSNPLKLQSSKPLIDQYVSKYTPIPRWLSTAVKCWPAQVAVYCNAPRHNQQRSLMACSLLAG